MAVNLNRTAAWMDDRTKMVEEKLGAFAVKECFINVMYVRRRVCGAYIIIMLYKM